MALQIDKEGYPLLVKAEYRPVFYKFLETEAVQSLPDEETRALAFISYMQKIDRSVRYNFSTEIKPEFNTRLLRMFLRKHGLIHGLKVVEFSAKLHTDQNTFMNALFNPTFVGLLRFEKGSGTVNNTMEFVKPTLFRGRLPRQFLEPKKLKTVLLSKTQWVRLHTNPMLEMAVYRERGRTGMLLRYQFALDQIFFYGGKESSVNKLQSNIKRQIMARRLYE